MKETELKPCPFCKNENTILITCCEVNCHKENCEDCGIQTFAICCDFNNGGCGAVGWIQGNKERSNRCLEQEADDERRENL